MLPQDIWRGLGGVGTPPSCLGSEFGPMLVVGDGRGVWDDIAAVEAAWGVGTFPVIACGLAGTVWPEHRLDYWASLHSDDWIWGYWLQMRRSHCDDGRVQTISTARHPAADGHPLVKNVLPCSDTFRPGSSGLYAALSALMLGAEQVVLAGVPLDDGGRFFEPAGRRTYYADNTACDLAWRQAIKRFFAGRVTSLSGRTRKWLGGPFDKGAQEPLPDEVLGSTPGSSPGARMTAASGLG